MFNWLASFVKTNPRRAYPQKWQQAKDMRNSLQDGHIDQLYIGFCDSNEDSDKNHPYFYIYHYSWPWSGLFPKAQKHKVYWLCAICDQEGFVNHCGNRQTASLEIKPCWV